MPQEDLGSERRLNWCSICNCQFADGLLTAAKGIRIDMFTPQNNVALSGIVSAPTALRVWECANRLDSTNLKSEISIGFFLC